MVAQKKVIPQSLIWLGWNETIEFKNNWYLNTEIENRTFILPTNAQHQLLVRSHIHKTIQEKKWDFSAGMCIFLNSPNNPNAIEKLVVPELRPHVEVIRRNYFKQKTIEQRLRIEARFFHSTNADRSVLEDGFQFSNYRIRYKCQFVFPIIRISKQMMVKGKLNDEMHLHFSGKTVSHFDQNRIYAGVTVETSPKFSIDIGYMNWYQFQSYQTFYNRDIFRLGFSHKFSLSK
ncbi:MAG: DUF2490 domain-containing protein [Chitinophagaceae bacterium]